MKFEKDTQTGSLIRGCMIAYIILIIASILFGFKVMRDDPSRALLAWIIWLCGAYMLAYMVRFVRLYGLWRRAWIELDGDSVKGFGGKGKFGWGKTLELPASSVEVIELVTVPLTRKTPLPALKVTSSSGEYYILGLEIDEQDKLILGIH